MTPVELLAFLQDFHRDMLQLVLARQANARSVGAYDANNAYQQVLGRQDVHLRWVEDAIAGLGAPVGDLPSGESAEPPAKKEQIEQLIQAGFVDCHLALSEPGDLFGVRVYARNINAEFCEACSGDQSNVAGANDGYVHFGLRLEWGPN